MKLFNDFRYQGYIKQNFKSLYEIYIFMKNTKSIKDIEEMKILIKIVSDHFKYLLLETNRKLYENMEEI